jgi:hypothetical protein
MDYVTRSRKFASDHAEHIAVVEEEDANVLRALVNSSDVYEAYNPSEYFYNGPEIIGQIVKVVPAFRHNPDESIRQLERALAASPDDASLHQQLVRARQRAGVMPHHWTEEDIQPGMVFVHVEIEESQFMPSPYNLKTLQNQTKVGDVWRVLEINTSHEDFEWLTPEGELVILRGPETILGPVHQSHVKSREGLTSYVWCRPRDFIRILNRGEMVMSVGAGYPEQGQSRYRRNGGKESRRRRARECPDCGTLRSFFTSPTHPQGWYGYHGYCISCHGRRSIMGTCPKCRPPGMIDDSD